MRQPVDPRGPRGLFILVAGPSGSGKDTLIAELKRRRPAFTVARRLITRAVDAGGEAHESVTRETFDSLSLIGALILSWRAHGLDYGISRRVVTALDAGRDVIANVSRTAIWEARELYGPVLVLHVTAPRSVLAERLAQRGRESRTDIEERLDRSDFSAPQGPDVIEIVNAGAIGDAAEVALAAIDGADRRRRTPFAPPR